MAGVVEGAIGDGGGGSAAGPVFDPRVRRALARYRVVAWVVGIVIILLLCVGMPLDFIGGHPGVDKYLGIAHGMVLYPLFWIVTIALAWRVRMPPIRLALTLIAGTVPFLSFVAERQTTGWVSARS